MKRRGALKFPRILLLGSLALFVIIGASAGIKKFSASKPKAVEKKVAFAPPKPLTVSRPTIQESGELPAVNRIGQLFTTGDKKLPIVETISYESTVPWLKGRPAWIGDYASYYSTSRHFIARSLNGKADYFTQKISPGKLFNVFRKDKNFQFYLLADLSRCKMAFYYIDLDANERVLLKTYKIGVGKKAESPSGSLTPIGRYQLGDKIAVYKPGIMGLFHDKQVELIRVFGTRWLPFGKELGKGTAPSKGLGIHGAPWDLNQKEGKWVEQRQAVGSYESDGCIRMAFEDIEELFSIVITKPTIVDIVRNFKEAQLPGVEVVSPKQ
jgi:hypothetical protein